MAVKYKNKVNENKLDYEPWGYREGVGYVSSSSEESSLLQKFFANVSYSKKDEKIHFYNIKGEEKGVINVKEFPYDHIKSTSYDAGTKVLTIKYESGKTIKINLTNFIETVLSDVENEIQTLSGTVQEIISGQTDIQKTSFSNCEYVWDEEENKMMLKFYNTNTELRDSVEIFDTNEGGEIMMQAGNF